MNYVTHTHTYTNLKHLHTPNIDTNYSNISLYITVHVFNQKKELFSPLNHNLILSD